MSGGLGTLVYHSTPVQPVPFILRSLCALSSAVPIRACKSSKNGTCIFAASGSCGVWARRPRKLQLRLQRKLTPLRQTLAMNHHLAIRNVSHSFSDEDGETRSSSYPPSTLYNFVPHVDAPQSRTAIYHDLNNQKREVRLLEILSGDAYSQPVHCRILLTTGPQSIATSLFSQPRRPRSIGRAHGCLRN
jgi:hypothetical protein